MPANGFYFETLPTLQTKKCFSKWLEKITFKQSNWTDMHPSHPYLLFLEIPSYSEKRMRKERQEKGNGELGTTSFICDSG